MPLSAALLDSFAAHTEKLRQAARNRRESVMLQAPVSEKKSMNAEVSDIRQTFGVMLPEDRWQGSMHLRTLRQLLKIVDGRGFERCAHTLPCA